MLEEWLNCQRSWLYLEPIFNSEDITRQLPVESKRYQTMERIWRKIMRNAFENREVSPKGLGGQLAPLGDPNHIAGYFLVFSLPKQELRTNPKASVVAHVLESGLLVPQMPPRNSGLSILEILPSHAARQLLTLITLLFFTTAWFPG